TPALAGRAEFLDLAHCNRIQREVIDERADVAGLLTDDFRACILENAGSVQAGLELGPNKILHGLTNTPDARVPLAGRPEKLHHFRCQCWGVEQEPALIEYCDTRSRGLSGRS